MEATMKMTSVETVQQIYACFGQGDVPGILEKLDEKVQWESWYSNSAQNAGVPWMKKLEGRANVVAFFQYIGMNMKINEFKVIGLMSGGNQVVAEIEIDSEITSTGGHFKDEELHLWTFNSAGKVVRFRHYLDTHKHMQAAKLV